MRSCRYLGRFTADIRSRLLAETMNLHHQIQNQSFGPKATTDTGLSANVKGKQRERNAGIDSQEQRTNTALQELAKPLNGNRGLPSPAEAANLLTNAMIRENCENRRSAYIDYTKLWSFAAAQPIQARNRYFSMTRWPANQQNSSEVARRKRRATDAPPNQRRFKRQKHASARQGPSKSIESHSTRLHLEESSSVSDGEDSRLQSSASSLHADRSESSRDQTPELGQGKLMPPEMQEFDISRHGEVLENAPDPKEKYWPGGGEFAFGETGFLQGIMGGRVGRDLIAGDLDNHSPSNTLPPNALGFPAVRFRLPRAPPENPGPSSSSFPVSP